MGQNRPKHWLNGHSGLKFWQKSSECKRCGTVLRDDLSAAARRDDLINTSSLVTSNAAGPLCASCRLVHDNTQFNAGPSGGKSTENSAQNGIFDENHSSIGHIVNWILARGLKLLIWVFIAVFTFLKLSGIINLFDDEPTDVPELITYEQEPIEAPTRVLEGDSAIPFNSPAQWVGPFDYPSDALRDKREGTTIFELTISEQGKVSDCNIRVSSGHRDLDEATCGAIMKRANFYKGLNESDIPIESKYSNRVRWQIPE